MANLLHADNSQIFIKHQHNILATLSHRLEIAKATNNFQLIELLEREKQQVSTPPFTQRETRSQQNWLSTLKQRFMQAIAHRDELQVSEFMNGSDHWWYAFDPRTGECVYADSEVEMRLWIQENYRGK